MGFSRFWLTMAVKEIKLHRRVICMIFPIIQRAKNDRSVWTALLVYDNVSLVSSSLMSIFSTNVGHQEKILSKS